MYKTIVGIHRREDLSFDQFMTHWHEVHANLVRKHAKALGIIKYVQVHLPEASSRSKYDGIAEVWYESEATFREHMKSEAGQEAASEILADEKAFMNGAGNLLFRGYEAEIIGR